MSRPRQFWFGLAAAAIALTASAQTEETVPARLAAFTTNMTPPMPVMQSPVNFFRQLLLMSPTERNQSLAGRTATARAAILAKLREYQALPADERELRLRATELRWYLMPLLRTPAAARDLSGVPPEYRELVATRLAQWDLLPSEMQKEFLANDKALHYFTQTQAAAPPNPDQQKIADQFDQILSLNAREKEKLLRTLSDVERTKMKETLEAFGQLPPQQRSLCVHNYAKFAGMTGAERAEFLKNAENWSQMSPQERQTWRDLVAHVPMWPPLPPMTPPMPPQPAAKPAKTSMATN
jgi:hypothetical protein